jgi:hypothetical protein
MSDIACEMFCIYNINGKCSCKEITISEVYITNVNGNDREIASCNSYVREEDYYR